jgi:HSF-type DNA-binding
MQTTSPSSAGMGPPHINSPDVDQGLNSTNGGMDTTPTSAGPSLGAAAVANSSGPKVVQTAFIHKLYNMLEDRSIQHLISWSNTNESFVMSPSNEFSKVLAQYFKHTNISSFVRQLNMYGFHKVSDVFHTGSPDSTLWEFKHGNGNFKKGDLMGLREIKRRASRHTLIHRDSFSGQKAGPSQPGTPAEPTQDTTESRVMSLEYAYHDMLNRLARTEDSYALMSSRVQALTEGLVRCHQWTHGLSHAIQSLAPPETGLYSDIIEMQKEIARQLEQVRALEHPHEALLNGRQPFFSSMSLDGPLSPRDMSMSFDQSRRSSVQLPGIPDLARPPLGRPPVPPIPAQYASSPRQNRFGSISAAQPSPGFSRPPLPPQPHPLSSVIAPPPNLARRHTSADIREHGWPVPNQNGSPYASGNSSVQWPPSSPHHTPQQQPHVGVGLSNPNDQGLRDHLAAYEINGPRRQTVSIARQPSPPGVDNVGWSLGASKFPRPSFELHSAPATRRSSMASNVHSLLNPAETAEREDEDGGGMGDERKRKRI